MSAPVTASRYLSVREAAERLSVSERTVRRLLAVGAVPAVRLSTPGSAVRIPEDALERYLWQPGNEAA